jgi:hypothetical protein
MYFTFFLQFLTPWPRSKFFLPTEKVHKCIFLNKLKNSQPAPMRLTTIYFCSLVRNVEDKILEMNMDLRLKVQIFETQFFYEIRMKHF